MNSQVKKYLGRGPEGFRAQQLLSLWHWGAQSSSMDVFTNLEAPGTPCYWDFMEASSHRHDQLLTPFLALSLLWRMGAWG